MMAQSAKHISDKDIKDLVNLIIVSDDFSQLTPYFTDFCEYATERDFSMIIADLSAVLYRRGFVFSIDWDDELTDEQKVFFMTGVLLYKRQNDNV